MNRFRPLIALILIMSGALLAVEDEDTRVLEEVTVTARKQQVDLQKAPVAVSVTDGEDFERARLSRLDNFNGYVPGLVVAKNDGAGRVVAIRGVGWETAQNLSTQPSVLVYVDGVYLANPLALGLDLGQIERIEVLRGPQGTEFGQGTTGGAINIITRKPEHGKTGGSVGLDLGDHQHLRATASLNLALGDHAALAASVQKLNHDGYAQIRGGDLDGYDLDDADALIAHLSHHWTPSENVILRLQAWSYDSDNHGVASKHINDPNPDARELTQDYPGTFALENTHLAATLEWHTPLGFTLRSLTGYQDLAKRQTLDGDRLTEALTSVNLTGFAAANFDVLPYWDNDSRAFSQELNLTRSSESTDWVLGAYYLDHRNDNDFLESTGPAPFSQFEAQLANPGPDTLPPFTPPLEFVETRALSRRDAAIYGQLTQRLNSRYALTLGARYQRDKSIDTATQFWFNNSRQVLDDKALTWKIGLDVTPSDNHLLYLLVSTGWKNGGNNPGALIGGALDVPVNFEPESVTSFEIGSKNTRADGRARLNLTAFYYDYKDYQFIQEDPIPFSGGTGNIAAVTIYGLETEFQWLLSERWRLDGSLAGYDGEIQSDLLTLDTVDFLNSGFGRFLPTGVTDRESLRVNLNGNTPPKLVDLSGFLRLTYTGAMGLSAGVDTVYRGEFEYRVFNHPEVDRVPDYQTFGAFVDYKSPSMPLQLRLTVTNAFDEDGVNSRFSNPFGLHTTSEEYIPPRLIMGSVQYRF